MPPNSCDPERGFSALRLLKTHLRNTLSQAHIDQALELHINQKRPAPAKETVEEARDNDLADKRFVEQGLQWWLATKNRRGTNTWSHEDARPKPGVTKETSMQRFQWGEGQAEATVRAAATLANAETRQANHTKRERAPCTDPDKAVAEQAVATKAHSALALFGQTGRHAWESANDGEVVSRMTVCRNDEIAYWFDDLGEADHMPGFAVGRVKSVSAGDAGATAEVLYLDGLVTKDTPLNAGVYGTDKSWVFLKQA